MDEFVNSTLFPNEEIEKTQVLPCWHCGKNTTFAKKPKKPWYYACLECGSRLFSPHTTSPCKHDFNGGQFEKACKNGDVMYSCKICKYRLFIKQGALDRFKEPKELVTNDG